MEVTYCVMVFISPSHSLRAFRHAWTARSTPFSRKKSSISLIEGTSDWHAKPLSYVRIVARVSIPVALLTASSFLRLREATISSSSCQIPYSSLRDTPSTRFRMPWEALTQASQYQRSVSQMHLAFPDLEDKEGIVHQALRSTVLGLVL